MSGEILDRIGRIHRAWKRQVAHDLVPYGITPKQVFLLRELARRPLSPSEIAAMLYTDRATTTLTLSTLEGAGWIARGRDPEDDKRVLVEIATAGVAKLESVPERLWRSTRLDPEATLTAAERATLNRLLHKLEAALDDDGR